MRPSHASISTQHARRCSRCLVPRRDSLSASQLPDGMNFSDTRQPCHLLFLPAFTIFAPTCPIHCQEPCVASLQPWFHQFMVPHRMTHTSVCALVKTVACNLCPTAPTCGEQRTLAACGFSSRSSTSWLQELMKDYPGELIRHGYSGYGEATP